MGFQEPSKAVGSGWDRLGENIVFGGLSWRQMGVHFGLPEGQKGNIGLEVLEEIAQLVAILEGAPPFRTAASSTTPTTNAHLSSYATEKIIHSDR
jgi:hypothetical protein